MNKLNKKEIDQRLKELDKYRVFKAHKRNGNGLTRCRLCNQITWDTDCYDLKVYCYETLINETIICSDCNKHIRKEEIK